MLEASPVSGGLVCDRTNTNNGHYSVENMLRVCRYFSTIALNRLDVAEFVRCDGCFWIYRPFATFYDGDVKHSLKICTDF